MVSVMPCTSYPTPRWEKQCPDTQPFSYKDVDHFPPLAPAISPKAKLDAAGEQPDSKVICEQTDSKVIVAVKTVVTMGIPETLVQLANKFHLLEYGTNFTDAIELYEVAEDLLSNPGKQASICKKLYEQEQKEEKALVDNKDSATKGSVSHSAEMLKEKVKTLAQENHRLRQRKTCRECKKVDLASSGVTFLPCGHFITCETCSEKFDNCPACSKSIMGTVRTFLS